MCEACASQYQKSNPAAIKISAAAIRHLRRRPAARFRGGARRFAFNSESILD
jgi:hypothetical protein